MTTNRFHDDANDLVHDLVHDRLFGCASALQTALGNFSNVYVYVDSVARTKVQRCGAQMRSWKDSPAISCRAAREGSQAEEI